MRRLLRFQRRVIPCALAYALAWPSSLGASLSITSGAADHQVFQRAGNGLGLIRLRGRSDENAEGRRVEARVTGARISRDARKWRPIGTVANGVWTGEVRDVPTGGPYELTLRVAGEGSTVVRDLFVGDLWVLAGQSNMEGVGDLVNVQPPSPFVHSFDQMDNWVIAQEPLHLTLGAVDRVHWARSGGVPQRLTGPALQKYIAARKKGAGLGLPFAVELNKQTGVPIGLIPCAHGGTSMDQWSPDQKEKGGDSLYGAMCRRIAATGGSVKGVLWYQGEADANPKLTGSFPQKFEKFVARLRADLHQPALPFYFVQLSHTASTGDRESWNTIQEMQRAAEQVMPNTGMAASIDLPLDDRIHVSADGHKRLGRRLAKLALIRDYPEKANGLRRGPHLQEIRHEHYDGGDQRHSFDVVRVLFSDVNGGLESEGRPTGFSLHLAGQELPLIFRTAVNESNRAEIDLYSQQPIPNGSVLRYGFGRNPYCNVNDSADMAIPAFGPAPIPAATPTGPRH